MSRTEEDIRTQERHLRSERTAELFARAANATSDEEYETLINEVIVINMCVAEAIVSRFRTRGIAEEDLAQIAYLALTRAAQKFDLSQDRDFLSYAVPTMTGEIKRYFRDHGWMIRPPRRIQEAQTRIRRYLRNNQDASPTPAELAEALDLPFDDVVESLAATGCFTPISTDWASDENGAPLLDSLAWDYGNYHDVDTRATLEQMSVGLSERDLSILRMRFYEDLSQQEIGERLGVTQMQVSRLLARIFRNMRENANAATSSELIAA
jgi:RNA polymerase sigma-B factor